MIAAGMRGDTKPQTTRCGVVKRLNKVVGRRSLRVYPDLCNSSTEGSLSTYLSIRYKTAREHVHGRVPEYQTDHCRFHELHRGSYGSRRLPSSTARRVIELKSGWT